MFFTVSANIPVTHAPTGGHIHLFSDHFRATYTAVIDSPWSSAVQVPSPTSSLVNRLALWHICVPSGCDTSLKIPNNKSQLALWLDRLVVRQNLVLIHITVVWQFRGDRHGLCWGFADGRNRVKSLRFGRHFHGYSFGPATLSGL